MAPVRTVKQVERAMKIIQKLMAGPTTLRELKEELGIHRTTTLGYVKAIGTVFNVYSSLPYKREVGASGPKVQTTLV